VFVAKEASTVVGFACVWARVPSEEPDDDPSEFAFVSDPVVDPANRHHGAGRELISAAEEYARMRGARRIRLRVFARNTAARGFYESMNDLEREIELEKSVETSAAADRSARPTRDGRSEERDPRPKNQLEDQE
jgi:ribosomal protein S18 acetylase RimI-like enzyme